MTKFNPNDSVETIEQIKALRTELSEWSGAFADERFSYIDNVDMLPAGYYDWTGKLDDDGEGVLQVRAFGPNGENVVKQLRSACDDLVELLKSGNDMAQDLLFTEVMNAERGDEAAKKRVVEKYMPIFEYTNYDDCRKFAIKRGMMSLLRKLAGPLASPLA